MDAEEASINTWLTERSSVQYSSRSNQEAQVAHVGLSSSREIQQKRLPRWRVRRVSPNQYASTLQDPSN